MTKIGKGLIESAKQEVAISKGEMLPSRVFMVKNGVAKYRHRKLAAAEFRDLRRRASVSIRDFMFMTGRHRLDVACYEGDRAQQVRAVQPTMGDVLLLELIARFPKLHPAIIGICNEYSEGPQLAPTQEKEG